MCSVIGVDGPALAEAGVVDDLVDATLAELGRCDDRPTGSSPAAAEIERQEAAFAGRSPWPAPISDTHHLGGVALLVAADSLRAYGRLSVGSPRPVFAHLVVAHAAVEASVNAAWLNQSGPGVTLEERARRGLVERYHAALQRRRVPELRSAADRHQEELKRIASSLRWTVVTGESDEELSVGGTRRPPPVTGARELIASGVEPVAATRLWESLAGVMQGSWHGAEAAVPDGGEGPEAALLLLYLRASQSRAELMGWDSPAWETARRRAEAAVTRLIGAVTARRPAGP